MDESGTSSLKEIASTTGFTVSYAQFTTAKFQ